MRCHFLLKPLTATLYRAWQFSKRQNRLNFENYQLSYNACLAPECQPNSRQPFKPCHLGSNGFGLVMICETFQWPPNRAITEKVLLLSTHLFWLCHFATFIARLQSLLRCLTGWKILENSAMARWNGASHRQRSGGGEALGKIYDMGRVPTYRTILPGYIPNLRQSDTTLNCQITPLNVCHLLTGKTQNTVVI